MATYIAYISINDTDGRSKNFTTAPTVTVWDGRAEEEIESPSPTLTNITTGLYSVKIELATKTDVLFKIVPDEDDEEDIADIKVIHEGYIETVETMGVGVKLDPVQGKVTWDQQKIIADVEEEGALHIVNENSDGYGQYNEGGNTGLYNFGASEEEGAGQANYSAGGIGQFNAGTQAVSGYDPAIKTGLALEATLTAIKGIGWTDETLVTIQSAIESLNTDSVMSFVIDGFTFEQIVQIMAAVLAGKVTGGATGTITFKDLADAVNRVVMTVDASGNRSAVQTNFS